MLPKVTPIKSLVHETGLAFWRGELSSVSYLECVFMSPPEEIQHREWAMGGPSSAHAVLWVPPTPHPHTHCWELCGSNPVVSSQCPNDYSGS